MEGQTKMDLNKFGFENLDMARIFCGGVLSTIVYDPEPNQTEGEVGCILKCYNIVMCQQLQGVEAYLLAVLLVRRLCSACRCTPFCEVSLFSRSLAEIRICRTGLIQSHIKLNFDDHLPKFFNGIDCYVRAASSSIATKADPTQYFGITSSL